MKAITEEQLEQVIEEYEYLIQMIKGHMVSTGLVWADSIDDALATLKSLPTLEFRCIEEHAAGFTSTQQRNVWEQQMKKIMEKDDG